MSKSMEELIDELVSEGMPLEEAKQKAAEVHDEQPPADTDEKEQDSEQPDEEAEAGEPDDEADSADDSEGAGEEVSDEGGAERDLVAENEALAVRLQEALVTLDGRLADPADLPFDPSFIDDPKALEAAITALVKKKPGLKAKQFGGNIGQGKRGTPAKPKPDLVSILKGL